MTNNNLDDFIIEGDTLIRYTGEDENVIIPGFTKRIAKNAFYFSKIVNVSIPASVTDIEKCAFWCCMSLRSVSIPENVTSIGTSAFQDCRNMTSVTISEGVKEIGESAFRGCDKLTSVAIPESVTSIGETAFSECNSLTRVTISGCLTSIGDSAFCGCKSLISVTKTEVYDSFDCNSLRSVTVSEGMAEIGTSAFRGCGSLTSVTIPEGVREISSSVFEGCSSLTSVTIPESVTIIGNRTFYGCRCLKTVTIPEDVREIGERAFEGCNSLTSVMIPEGVREISSSAFEDCSGLANVMIPEGVTKIGDRAFESCGRLTSVIIPEGVTKIGDGAFENCSSLTSVTIPESVLSIGERAFKDCRSLTEINSNMRLVKGIFDEKFSNPIITNDPGMLPNNMKPLAAIGFAENPDVPTSDRGKKHLKYIKANAAKLKNEAFSYPVLLRLMCDNKLLSPEVTDLYLSAAREIGNTELTAMLLDYQQNRLTGKEKEKAVQKAETREEKVTEFVFSVDVMEQLQGKVFVVTGKLATFSSRDEFKACLDACGAILSETLNEKTNYLITNTPNSGSAKNKKADALGVIKLSEAEFNHMIGRKLQ